MGNARKKISVRNNLRGLAADDRVFWLALALLVAVPLAFSSFVYTRYSLPKFVLMVVGSSVLTLLLALRSASSPADGPRTSKLVLIVYLYFAVVGVSAVFGVASLSSIFGSHFSYMGLITRICFLLVFVALIAGIGASEKRLRAALWGMAVTGFLTAAYAMAQSFGFEPFVSRSLYTFASPEGPLVRASGTLGHSNYLGNFLLYTTPVAVVLALVSQGWRRLVAIAGAALSVGAIVFSGTRGAWVGIAAGGITFALVELKKGGRGIVRGHPVAVAVGLLVAMLLAVILVISPVSRSVRERAKALWSEGASSSGRMLLWRDSLRMVPAYSLVGCGPEGFRKAFLEFKSDELARLSPKANNESPHSAYLETVISHGIAGAVLYAAMICLALRLFVLSSRRINGRLRLLITGMAASLVAALVHNIFIFDQIATGLYFFAFIALAQATSNVTTRSAADSKTETRTQPSTPATPATARTKPSRWSRALATGAVFLILASVWYSAGLIRSDRAYRSLQDPSNPVDFERLTQMGKRITDSPLPTGAYDFIFARVVDTFIRQLAKASSTGRVQSTVDLDAVRAQAARLGIEHAQKSLAHTLTPELNYSLLASLALAAGDVDKFRNAAREAVKWDPKNYSTRLLMAEAYLARGDREGAAREAEIALDYYRVSRRAASVLARATGLDANDESVTGDLLARSRVSRRQNERTVEGLIDGARKLARSNKLRKAEIMLRTASFKADGPCPECHRELAIVYERMGRNSEAIVQWERFTEQAPDRASSEQIQARIEALKQKKDKPKQ